MQAKVKNKVFVKLDIRYTDYFPEYAQYFGRALRLLKSMYDLGKWFVDTLGKRFHVNFLGYAHWFMSKIISQVKDHSISVDKARYSTFIVAKYLDTATFKVSTKFYNTTFPAHMIFTKEDVYTSDEQVEKLTR